jgi:peptidoglycan/LPS O-acetylase OafA/YrhL
MIFVAWRYALAEPSLFFPRWPGWLVYTSPYWRVMEFGVGVLVAKLVPPKPQQVNLTAHMLGCAGLLLLPLPWLAQAYLPLGGIATVIGFAPALGLIIYYLAAYETFFCRLLGLPVLVLLGEASYSLYFLHPWLIPMFNTVPVNAWLFVYKQLAIWMMSIVLSIGLYTIFERPMRAYIRARLGPKSLIAGK